MKDHSETAMGEIVESKTKQPGCNNLETYRHRQLSTLVTLCHYSQNPRHFVFHKETHLSINKINHLKSLIFLYTQQFNSSILNEYEVL